CVSLVPVLSSPACGHPRALHSSYTTLFRSSMIVSQGRVGAAVALREARTLLYQKRHRAVVIAGVDSYLNEPTLRAYESSRRLLTAENTDGFIPGEGAAAIIVRRPARSNEPQLCLVGLGFAVESATVDSEQPLRADGLAAAIRAALTEAGTSMHALDYRIADVSGEHYYFKETALALSRILRVRKEEFDLWHPADSIG